MDNFEFFDNLGILQFLIFWKILIYFKYFDFLWKFFIFQPFSIGGLFSPTKSLWWLVWSQKIAVVAYMDTQNHFGSLYGPTKSLWWPVWSHKITVVACMIPRNHCGGLCGPTKSLWWPVWTHKITVVVCAYKAARICWILI